MKNIQAFGEIVIGNLEKVIVGKRATVEMVVIGLLCQGHGLIEDVPGVGKTILARSLARSLDCAFSRIQFTPDMLPSDVTGVSIYDQSKKKFEFRPGPIMGQIVLADEINRATPKTQAALLEAMGERHVTAGGHTYDLEEPFFVLATQNPIELEGTYPLPEAQLDRFLINVVMQYLTTADEERMVRETTAAAEPSLDVAFDAAEILEIQQLVRAVPVSDNVISYAVRLASATRPSSELAPAFIREKVKWGAGSRASQALILAGKARALLQGRYNVACEDIRALAMPVLRHRVITNFHADAEGVTSDHLIRQLIDTVRE